MYNLQQTGSFKKDLKVIKKRSLKDFELLRTFLLDLKQKGAFRIDNRYKAHKLSGKFSKYWECHVKNDLLIIWLQSEDQNTITLVRTGSHADLF